jgi:hypothetical protein
MHGLMHDAFRKPYRSNVVIAFGHGYEDIGGPSRLTVTNIVTGRSFQQYHPFGDGGAYPPYNDE